MRDHNPIEDVQESAAAEDAAASENAAASRAVVAARVSLTPTLTILAAQLSLNFENGQSRFATAAQSYRDAADRVVDEHPDHIAET